MDFQFGRGILLALWALAASALSAAEQRPNLLIILADDLGYGDLSCYGASDLKSPHLDRLCRQGMRLTGFYANSCVCSPTRAALLSGCYPERVGVPGVIRTHADNSWGYLSPSATLLPAVARQAGYATAIIGKWHLGLESPNTPPDRGFDHFHGFLGDMMDDYYTHRRHGHNYMRRDRTVIDPNGHATDLFADWAVEYIRSRKNQTSPFLLYLAFNAPHSPIQPPEEWLEKVRSREPGLSDRRAALVALIEHLDDAVGRVLEALDTAGLEQNTIVVFTSDNGGSLPHGASNGPLRDGKGSMYEGGLKVPAFVRWPENIAPGSETDLPVLTMDILPTLLDAANADVDFSSIDGRSFLPTLLGQQQDSLRPRRFFVRREGGYAWGGKTADAVQEGPWKLLQNTPFSRRELYRLDTDPQERLNVIDRYPQVARRLSAAMRRQIQEGARVPWQRPARVTN